MYNRNCVHQSKKTTISDLFTFLCFETSAEIRKVEICSVSVGGLFGMIDVRRDFVLEIEVQLVGVK